MHLTDDLLEELADDEVEEFEELLGFMPHLPGFSPGEQFSGGNLTKNDDSGGMSDSR